MSKSQIPRGSEDLKCPLWKKSMDQVCHTCPWWVQVRGVNRNTGAEVDEWGCSIGLMPLLQIETAHQGRTATAATESFRNEMVAIAMSGPPVIGPRQHAIANHAPAHPMLPNGTGGGNGASS
jgi:hypothetical protein